MAIMEENFNPNFKKLLNLYFNAFCYRKTLKKKLEEEHQHKHEGITSYMDYYCKP